MRSLHSHAHSSPVCSPPRAQLTDLNGAILGAFELPILADGVTWLTDGRRVLLTQSHEWYPSLWDGAALSALPLPSGFAQVQCSPTPWNGSDGRRLHALTYSLHATPADAPIVLVLFDPRDPTPMLGARGGLIGSASVPLLPLLRCGYRVITVECAPPAGARAVRAGLSGRALITDVVLGLDAYLNARVPSASRRTARGPAHVPVGVIGAGLGGLLALHAVAWSERFDACVAVGAPISEQWADFESGSCSSLASAIMGSDADADGQGGARARMSRAAAHAGSSAAGEFELLSMLAKDASRRTPTLLFYADADPECGTSQAHAAFHALRGDEGLTMRPHAQLVLYHGDTNALRVPAHRRDAARRTCSWLGMHFRASIEPPPKPVEQPAPAPPKK